MFIQTIFTGQLDDGTEITLVRGKEYMIKVDGSYNNYEFKYFKNNNIYVENIMTGSKYEINCDGIQDIKIV